MWGLANPFLQPTFGYLIGYIARVFVVGWIIERIDNPKTYQFILANLAGLLVVYLIGVLTFTWH